MHSIFFYNTTLSFFVFPGFSAIVLKEVLLTTGINSPLIVVCAKANSYEVRRSSSFHLLPTYNIKNILRSLLRSMFFMNRY